MSINIERIKEILVKHNIQLFEGLTDEEFDKIESFYSIKFPSSLRLLYKSFYLHFIIGEIFPKKMSNI